MWKTFDNGGQEGAYWTEGQGDAVLLLHGFAEDHSVWEHQTAYLRAHYRVIVPDLPGTGRSNITAPLSMESMATFVWRVLQAEGLGSAVVIGHSMGGYVALAFAEAYPDAVDGLGLFSSTARPDTEEKRESRRKSIRIMQQYGVESFVKQLLPNMFAGGFRNAQAARVENYIDQAVKIPMATMIGYYEAMIARPDRTAVLSSIRKPVFFFVGKEDQAVPLENSMSQVVLPSTASIQIFDHVGHMGMLEVFEESSLLLHQFITFCQHVQ
ncbi:alpha/beta fold hydrolase [Chitinophaga rhizosphaerae]|uniref:alpha/beta fold hydrolase n=1 Tax=Chitinophaga rhizosphaerae TaxID=1864947 RepID=UPI000F7FDC90|nr:alpha/beta hydrolase [Chitinophaga rhizosphaerae]